VRLELGPVLRTFRRQPGVLAMVVLEMAVGVATICALLVSGSWYGMRGAVPSGLDDQNLIVVSSYAAASGEAAVLARHADLAARVRSVPGVESVAAVSTTILDERWIYPALFSAEAGDGGRQTVGWPLYTDGEIGRTLGLRVVAGVVPGAAPSGAVLTRCLAERIYGDAASAIGKMVSSEQSRPTRVQAVVEDVTMRHPFMPNAGCLAFLFEGAPVDNEARLVVRARAGLRDDVLPRLREAVARDTSDFVEVSALDARDATHRRIGRGLVRLLTIFGVMVGLVALLGALAATSFLVAERTRQIGIRRALGATKSDIVGYFLVESAFATTLGSLLGLGGMALLFLMMRPVFAALTVNLTLIGAALALVWIGSLAATLVPALRAARVPPSVASRSL
jgi:putative ABC transport system permease protein